MDKFLVEKLLEYSRSQIQKMIKEGRVLVGGKPAKVHTFLKEGDGIEVRIRGPLTPTLSPEGRGRKGEGGQQGQGGVEPKIIFEDENYFIIDKPSGMLVHPANVGAIHELPLRNPTLSDWLLQKYPSIKNVGEQNYRAGIIHRLDKDVSGVMVIAKTQKIYQHLKNQFKEREVKKEYLALVYGHMPEHEGKIEVPIGRNKEGRFVAHPRHGWRKLQDEDKHAITLYRVLKRFEKYDFLSVHILTGRTHQIRVHLQHLGHPIIGDTEYSPKKSFLKFFSRRIKVIDAPRIMLHSHKIGFKDLHGEWKEFESPIPMQLSTFISSLK